MTKCPVCSGRRLEVGVNDLATKFPDIAEEFVSAVTGIRTANLVLANSTTRAQWRCKKGHDFEQPVNKRTTAGQGCPICVMQKIVPGVNDLATQFPDLAREWKRPKFGDATPATTAPGSGLLVWWNCKEGHEFLSRVYNRTSSGSGCPYCAHRKLLPGYNDLATTHPDLALEWDTIRNGKHSPVDVFPNSTRAVWWRCRVDPTHTFRATPSSRVQRGHGCQICSGKQVQKGVNDLETAFPLLAVEWNHELNQGLRPSDLSAGSSKRVWWKCRFEHEWQQSPSARRTRGCPVCANQQFLVGFNDLETLHPKIARRLDLKRNELSSPSQVFAGGKKKYWWTCPDDATHYFEASIDGMVRGTICPVCTGHTVISGLNDLATNFPFLCKEWDVTRNGHLMPQRLAPKSNLKVWWICPVGHEYAARIASRANGSGCPICDNKIVLAGFNDLQTTHPELARQWHPSKNEKYAPDSVVAGTQRAIWWACEFGHEWKVSGAQRLSGTGCPSCAKYGFDRNKRAYLYFIENVTLGARKIGIGNTSSRRLQVWNRLGWQTHYSFEGYGEDVLECERALLRWVRDELGLPPYLGKEDMRGRGGQTETFGSGGPSNAEIIQHARDTASRILRSR